MARRSSGIQKQFFNPLEILLARESKTITLKGSALALIVHVLTAAKLRGPSVYGTKENRFPVPAIDELVAETLEDVSSDVLELGSWDAIKNNEEAEVTVTLSGPQTQLVRSVLSYLEDKGNAAFGIPVKDETETDNYRSIVSDALSKL
jgi:hypothetical protein